MVGIMNKRDQYRDIIQFNLIDKTMRLLRSDKVWGSEGFGERLNFLLRILIII